MRAGHDRTADSTQIKTVYSQQHQPRGDNNRAQSMQQAVTTDTRRDQRYAGCDQKAPCSDLARPAILAGLAGDNQSSAQAFRHGAFDHNRHTAVARVSVCHRLLH